MVWLSKWESLSEAISFDVSIIQPGERERRERERERERDTERHRETERGECTWFLSFE